MRLPIVACLAPVLACASSPPTPGSAPVEQYVSMPGAGTSLNVVPTSGLSTAQFAFPVDRVWTVMPAVFDSVSMPVSMFDVRTHTIGNSGVKLRGKLGKVGLGRYIDCGQTQIGPNAETYDVVLTLTTVLTAGASGGTAMTINVEASAKPMAFAQEP